MIDRRIFIAGTFVCATTPAWVATPRKAASKAATIDAIALPDSFNGTLAYGRRGRIEHIRCAGFADVEAYRPVTPATRFKWGSASKWLASVAALRMVDQGQLSLDAPITTYLPDFRPDTGDRVRLSHLLSNTSGIPDLLSRQLKTAPELRTSDATSAAMVRQFAGGDLAFTPGEGWDYAALNWVIVAALLERVSGDTFPNLVTRLVLRPLGMTGAGFAQANRPAMSDLAAAYTSAVPPVRKMSPVPPFVAASGNVAGTARDAIRASHGIFHGTLLSARSRTSLTTIRWAAQDYALGGRVTMIDGDPWAWETGKIEGYRAHIAHRLADSETIVVFNNTDMDQSTITAWVETVARG